jgi:hypothetical protein
MNNTSPENSTPVSPERSDQIKKGLDIFARAVAYSEQLPQNFTPSTSFSANLKSLHPSVDPYNVYFREMREFMANKALQEESGLTD